MKNEEFVKDPMEQILLPGESSFLEVTLDKDEDDLDEDDD